MYLYNLYLEITSTLLLVGGLGMGLNINPVISVFFLIFVFFMATFILILIGADFLGSLILIIYVGAIAVLFLFMVMMLNLKNSINTPKLFKNKPDILSFFIICALVVLYIRHDLFLEESLERSSTAFINQYVLWEKELHSTSNIETIGKYFYTDFFFLFLLTTLFILVALIGSIALTLDKNFKSKQQNIERQISRSYAHSIKKIYTRVY